MKCNPSKVNWDQCNRGLGLWKSGLDCTMIEMSAGLVGDWKLAGDCRDHSGKGNHGIIHGVVVCVCMFLLGCATSPHETRYEQWQKGRPFTQTAWYTSVVAAADSTLAPAVRGRRTASAVGSNQRSIRLRGLYT